MRNRSTRVIVGLLLVAGVSTWSAQQAGYLLTGAVLNNGVMVFQAQSPYATMQSNGTITVPSGTDILVDWSDVDGQVTTSNITNRCFLYASRSIDGLGGENTSSTVLTGYYIANESAGHYPYGLRTIRNVTASVTLTLKCFGWASSSTIPSVSSSLISTQSIQVNVGAASGSFNQYARRTFSYPSPSPLSVTFTVRSGSVSAGSDGFLEVQPGSDVIVDWSVSGGQDLCSMFATDIPNPKAEFAAGATQSNNQADNLTTVNDERKTLLHRQGSLTLRNVRKSMTLALQCITNPPVQQVVSFRNILVLAPPPQCNDGIDNDGDGLRDYPVDPGCANKQDNEESESYASSLSCAAPAATESGRMGHTGRSLGSGTDGSMWFQDIHSQNPYRIGRMNTDLTYTYFNLQGPAGPANEIVLGPDGNLWITRVNQVDKISPAGTTIAQYTVPNATTENYTVDIAPDKDGSMWFTGSDRIGRIAADGTVTVFPLTPGPVFGQVQARAQSITAGSDGSMWFLKSVRSGSSWEGRIAKISPSGQMTEYQTPAAGGGHADGIVESGGNIFFLQTDRKIGRIDHDGSGYYQFSLSGLATADELRGISVGSDRNLWVLVKKGGSGSADGLQVIKMTGSLYDDNAPSAVTTSYPVGTPGSDGFGIAAGTDGALWVSDSGLGSVWRISCNASCNPYATAVVSSSPLGEGRISADGVLGAPDAVNVDFADAGSQKGWVTVTFAQPITNAQGDDFAIYLDDFFAGEDVERFEVFVSNGASGTPVSLGQRIPDQPTRQSVRLTFDIAPSGLSQVTHVTVRNLLSGNSIGPDINAFENLTHSCGGTSCSAQDPRIACVTAAMQFTANPIVGSSGKDGKLVYWDVPLSARDLFFNAVSSCGLEVPGPYNFTSGAMQALVQTKVGSPKPYRPVFVDLNCSPANVNLYRSAGHTISDTDVGPGTDVNCTQQYLNYKVNFYANSTLTSAPVDPATPGAVNIEGIGDGSIGYAAAICDPSQTNRCKAAEFDAAKGSFVSQGWTARAEPAGSVTPVTEDGVKAMRMTDNSSTTGVAMSVPIPASAIEDKDWSLEMRAKVRESVGHQVGINMLLLIPNHRHIGLYIAKDKFGPIDNSLAYIQPVSRNTTDAFHTYVVRHKKNGAGKADDTIDVYFDGEKVISDVLVSSIANPPTGSDGYLSVGQLSSEGQGSMDVQYVRFWNDADPCVNYSVACGVAEFYASQGSLESQGWTPVTQTLETSLRGPATENGVTYVRLTDQSTSRGLSVGNTGITNSMLSDRDWTLEMKSRTVESTPGSYVLGMNMLLATPDRISTSLFIDTGKFGMQAATPNSYTWGPSVNKNTKDAFHTYAIRNKKNGPGGADDTVDVYFDGQRVLTDVKRDQLYKYDVGAAVNGIVFGIASSPGKGVMDVAYVRFKNDEAACPADPFKVLKPQCSDGIDNDGDGLTDYKVVTKTPLRSWGPVTVPITTNQVPSPLLEERFTVVDSLVAGQVVKLGDSVSGNLQVPGYTGTNPCSLFIKNTYNFQNPIPLIGAFVDAAGNNIRVEDTNVSWFRVRLGGEYVVPAGAVKLMFYPMNNYSISGSCTISAGQVLQVSGEPGDPDCSGPSDDSEVSEISEIQCSDGIDNDGDGKTDYATETEILVKNWGPVGVSPGGTPVVAATGLQAGQFVRATLATGDTVCENILRGNSAGSYYFSGIFTNDAGTIIQPSPPNAPAAKSIPLVSDPAWPLDIFKVPNGATQLRVSMPSGISFTGTCTLSGKVFEMQRSPNWPGDPECTSADGLSESAAVPATCSDTDPTDKLDVQGFVNATGGPVTTASDTCDALGKLVQYSCSAAKAVTSTSVTCPAGSACSEGACVGASSSAAAILNPTRTGFGGVMFDGNDVIFTPFQNGDAAYHGNVLAFGPVCKPATCGDGVLTSDEQCDDGNTVPGDGCNAKCIWEPYAGATSSRSSSSSSSSAARCGDGIITAPEKCDDGNTTGGDGCSAFCQVETGWQCTPRLP